ncbi:MAG: GDP-mannose 4,6-dehydratase [Candidatus Hodarchaeota archaeon]
MNWNEKKVLVTGGCGFIGSHLVELLQSLGAKIRVFARYTSSGSLGNLSFIPHNDIEIIYGDLRSPFIVRKAMKDIDIVFHLASLISIPYSYIDPSEYFAVNINSILNILESTRDLSTELVIHTSTSEVYGTAQYVPIDEKHPLQGQSPYSASKIAADKVAESFFLSFDLPVITVRPFNTFGPRQSTRAIIPHIIKQLLKDSTLRLGDLTPTRDFLYVKDTVNGFVTAAENSEKLVGRTVNIGTGKEIAIKDLAELIGRILNVQPVFQTDKLKLRPSKSEVRRLCCDAGQFISLTNWKPKYTLKQGLKETIEFYRNFGEYFHQSNDFL